DAIDCDGTAGALGRDRALDCIDGARNTDGPGSAGRHARVGRVPDLAREPGGQTHDPRSRC
ncbi:MAG TPA: hypothetical protein VIX73_12245, partial [Kofleriaceae bacterium]